MSRKNQKANIKQIVKILNGTTVFNSTYKIRVCEQYALEEAKQKGEV